MLLVDLPPVPTPKTRYRTSLLFVREQHCLPRSEEPLIFAEPLFEKWGKNGWIMSQFAISPPEKQRLPFVKICLEGECLGRFRSHLEFLQETMRCCPGPVACRDIPGSHFKRQRLIVTRAKSRRINRNPVGSRRLDFNFTRPRAAAHDRIHTAAGKSESITVNGRCRKAEDEIFDPRLPGHRLRQNLLRRKK